MRRSTTRLLVATKNRGKLAELRALFASIPHLDVVGADAFDKGLPDVEETGATYEENALLKARALARLAGSGLVLADDSGLEVDALEGAPGVRSARYSGGDAAQNVTKLLEAMADIPPDARTARFRAVIVLVDASGAEPPCVVGGTCEGTIALAPRGHGGFGYDPIFEPCRADLTLLGRDPDARPTLAELTDAEKNRISHRARAAQALVARCGSLTR